MKRLLSLTLTFALLLSISTIATHSTLTSADTEDVGGFLDRVKSDYTMVFNDEFNGNTLDTSKWQFDGQNVHRNSELQTYADSMDDGNLEFDGENAIIVPKIKTTVTANGKTKRYTAAEISTQGKQAWKYGYFEVRAKISGGKNIVPAIWLLGYDYPSGSCDWPYSGEIDIMETFGAKSIESTLHHGAAYGSKTHKSTGAGRASFTDANDPNTTFHNYWLFWTDKYLVMGCDENMFSIMDITSPELAQSYRTFEHWLILNVALGMFSNPVNDSEVEKWKMYIDYVRVYQLQNDADYDKYLTFNPLNIKSNGNQNSYYKTVSNLKTLNDLTFTMNDELSTGKYDVYAEVSNNSGVTDTYINGTKTSSFEYKDMGTDIGRQVYVGSVDLQDDTPFDIKFKKVSSSSVAVKKLNFVKCNTTVQTPVVVNSSNSRSLSDYIEVATEDELINAAYSINKNGTIKLTQNITLTKAVELFDACTIDLNGNTITASNTSAKIRVNDGKPIIKNGDIVLASDANGLVSTKENYYNAEIELDDVDVTINTTKSGTIFSHSYGGINTVCNNCTFTYTNTNGSLNITRGAATFKGCTLNLNSHQAFLIANGSSSNTNKINFYNCNINNAANLFYSNSALTQYVKVTLANSNINNLTALSNFYDNANFVYVANNNVLKDSNSQTIDISADMTGNYTVECTHSYVDATCTSARHCEYCYLEDGAPLGHIESTTTTPATCLNKGKIKTVCTRCEETLSETLIPVTEHNYQLTQTYEPSCSQRGYHLYTCSECGMQQQRSYYGDGRVIKLNHTFDETQTVVHAPTCTMGGYTEKYCTTCQKTIKSQYKLGYHTYSDGVCTRCGADDPNYEGPVNPTDPTDPTDPTEPTEPSNPTDPTDPSQPIDTNIDMTTQVGASIRLNEHSGLRFYTQVDKDKITQLRNAGYTVELGTLIAPYDFLGANALSFDLAQGQYVDVPYASQDYYGEGDFSGIVGSIVNIKENTTQNPQSGNILRYFVARGYARITDSENNTAIVYADYNKNAPRSLGYVAYMFRNDNQSNALYLANAGKVDKWADFYEDARDPSVEDIWGSDEDPTDPISNDAF